MDTEQVQAKQIQIMVAIKKCSSCCEDKPADTIHFPKNNSSKDGWGHWCKKCHAAYRTKNKIS